LLAKADITAKHYGKPVIPVLTSAYIGDEVRIYAAVREF